ncbi:hypothetical protein LJR084_007064 [Variovorax sp. LjRoot84]|uniref:hypothetical protein n=1 Tax=Variovorax sp. LjRoot84 TaxID=3342340 RepID=UPI003ECDD763
MPTKIVDFSARSKIIRAEPFNAHFWECTPLEFKAYLGKPREFLRRMGIGLPADCRIETTIENHDWLGQEAPDFDGENDTVICNVGSGNVARHVYRVISYAHDRSAIGEFEKQLLHKANQQQVKEKVRRGKKRKAK